MRNVFVFVFVFVLTGCSTSRQVSIVEHSVHDTLYLNKVQYDSIFIDNYQSTDRINDTVYLDKTRIEYRYKLLRDTVKSTRVDSIPVIHEVQVTKNERYVPSIYKWSLAFCIILIAIILVMIAFRFYLRITHLQI